MRIASGRFKGRNIRAAKGIRTTQDKVKQALFNILGDIQGLSFLDLYAGSGAMGLEALSRGAAKVVFVEKDSSCIRAIRGNLLNFGLAAGPGSGQAPYKVIQMDANKLIGKLGQRDEQFDIIFLDPPYSKGMIPHRSKDSAGSSGSGEGLIDSLSKKTLKSLSCHDKIAQFSLVVCQHFKRDILPEAIGGLHLIKQAKYGDTLLSFYKGSGS